jgi:hypothetical protein
MDGGDFKRQILIAQGIGTAGEADALAEFFRSKQMGFLGLWGRYLTLENSYLALPAIAIATAGSIQ